MYSLASKAHLVPVVKGAVDPQKGLIYRTYYVSPDQLKKNLERARKDLPQAHVSQVTRANDIDRSIKTGDITDFRNEFPKNSKSWDSIVKRNTELPSLGKQKHHKQKLMQSVYSFSLSQNPVFKTAVKQHHKNSITSKKFKVVHKEKSIKKSLKRMKRGGRVRVREKVYIKYKEPENDYTRVLEDFSVMEPVTRSFTQRKDTILNPTGVFTQTINQELEKPDNPDLGIDSSYEVKVSLQDDPVGLGYDLSKFFSFINSHPTKVTEIVDQLISKGTLQDSSRTVNNMVFHPSVYFDNPEFWTNVLSLSIVDYQNNKSLTGVHDPSRILYHELMLRQLDKEKFNNIANSYSDEKLNYILRKKNNIDRVLYSDRLTDTEKSYYLASLPPDRAKSHETSIKMALQGQVTRSNDNRFLNLLSGYITSLTPTESYNFIQTINPEMLAIDNLVNEAFDVQTGSQRPSFRYFLLQALASKLAKTHYVPYESIQNIAGGPFAPSIVSKVFKAFQKKAITDFKSYWKSSRFKMYDVPDNVNVGIKLPKIEVPKDQQVFLKFEPIKVFDVVPSLDDPEYIVTGTVNKSNIVRAENNKVLVFNPSTSVNFNKKAD